MRSKIDSLLSFIIVGVTFVVIVLISDAREKTYIPNPAPVQIAPLTSSYVPPGSIFGQTDPNGICNCPYLYENSLLPGIVADTDYQHRYGEQQTVRLPGNQYDHYNYLGVVYVEGSGYVEEWLAPNGGRFDFLHLNAVYPRVVGVPKITGPGPEYGLGNVDLTYLAIQNVVPMPPEHPPGPPTTMSSQYYGGLAVGLSGWPTWPQYGQGVAGPANAHLCLLMDARAANWFYRVVTHRDNHAPKPKAFNIKLWEKYRRGHRLSLISPYYRHRLNWAASIWVHHQSLGGVKDRGHYYGHYTKTNFRFGAIFTWPKTHSFKVVKR